jgi:hypothetical protein
MGYAQDCSDFQEEYLKQLKKNSYAELLALPEKQRIETPRRFGGWKVFLLKKRGKNGRVRIEIEGQKRFLLMFVSKYVLGFEVLKDGTIVNDDTLNSSEQEIEEAANWFGKTGLSEETERELPRYLRLEFGESVLDDDYLKASDLCYIGYARILESEKEHFLSESAFVHCWKMPESDGENSPYAYVETDENGNESGMGMGSYLPIALKTK